MQLSESPNRRYTGIVRKSDSVVYQIAYRFKEKILKTLEGQQGTTLFWNNGISNLNQVQQLLDGDRNVEEPAEIVEIRKNWSEISNEIEEIRVRSGYGTGRLSLNNLHMIVRNAKNGRTPYPYLSHNKLDANALREIVQNMLSDADFKEFSFVLSLNEWISGKRGENIWD